MKIIYISNLICSGGDEEICVWLWENLLKLETHPTFQITCLSTFQHPQTRGVRGAMLPLSETNGICIDKDSQHLFAGAGDNNAYEIDLGSGKYIQSYEGHTSYLHSVSYLTTKRELVTASEDGTIGLWGTFLKTVNLSYSSIVDRCSNRQGFFVFESSERFSI